MKSYGVKFGDTFHFKKHNFLYGKTILFSFFFAVFVMYKQKHTYALCTCCKWQMVFSFTAHFISVQYCFCFDIHNKICMVYLKHDIQNVNNNYTMIMHEGKCPPEEKNGQTGQTSSQTDVNRHVIIIFYFFTPPFMQSSYTYFYCHT